MLRLLLLSSSRIPNDDRYLTWAADHLRDFLAGARTIAFVPYAGVTISYDDYTRRVREALGPLGCEIRGVHENDDPASVVRGADAVAVGGGNTFRLLERLQETRLIDAIGERVRGGAPYIGWSAGSNVACPTIRTTNDMPIVQPPSFAALGFLPFQINAHYTDYHPPGHMGETRADRLNEFVALNANVSVIGLREGSLLRLDDSRLSLHGAPPDAPIFRGGAPMRTVGPGDDLGFLMRGE